MKATIARATLLKSLGHVQSVVERRNTIPILSNVRLEAREDGSIRLMATDLDLQVDYLPGVELAVAAKPDLKLLLLGVGLQVVEYDLIEVEFGEEGLRVLPFHTPAVAIARHGGYLRLLGDHAIERLEGHRLHLGLYLGLHLLGRGLCLL